MTGRLMVLSHAASWVRTVMRALLSLRTPVEVVTVERTVFFEQDSYDARKGHMVWLSPRTYIIESPKWSACNARYYFVHYRDGITLKLTCDAGTMGEILAVARKNPHHRLARRIDRHHRHIRRYVLNNRSYLFNKLVNESIDGTFQDPILSLIMNETLSATVSTAILIQDELEAPQK